MGTCKPSLKQNLSIMSENLPEEIEFLPHYKGNGRKAFTIELSYDETGNPVNLTNAKIIMQLKLQGQSRVSWEFSTEEGSNELFTILNGPGGILQFPKNDSWEINAGVYIGDLRVIHADGFNLAYIRVTWPIEQNVSSKIV